MLELGEGDMMEKLDKELAGDIPLVGGKSFNGNENSRGHNDEGVEGVDMWCWERVNDDGLRTGWRQVGRFVSERSWEVWHLYGRGLEH